MRKYIVEFIGTFFLVLTIALAVHSGSALAPVAIGCMLMVMVYMGGHVSGAHYNPAVSAAVLIRGKMNVQDLGPYLVAQFAGALLASALGHFATGQSFSPAPAANISVPVAIAFEAVFTFALASVVLNVATHAKTAGNSYYGAAIGLTVAASAVAVGPVSGCALNPAVGCGTVLYRVFAGDNPGANLLVIYSVGPVLGGVAAAAVFSLTKGPDAD